MSVIDDGQRAKDILNSEPFRSVVDEVEEKIIDSWRSSEDSSEREACYWELHGLESVIRRLKAKVQAGELKLKE